MMIATVSINWLNVDPCWPPTGRKFLHNDYSNLIISSCLNAVADLFCSLSPFLVFRKPSVVAEPVMKKLYRLFGFGFLEGKHDSLSRSFFFPVWTSDVLLQ